MLKTLGIRGSLAAACLAVLVSVSTVSVGSLASSPVQEKQIKLAALGTLAPSLGSSIGHGDYLPEVCRQGIYHWTREKFPIKIYISPGTGVPGYRAQFNSMIRDAFDEWQEASEGKVSWTEVGSRNSADITVDWTNNVTQRSNGTEAGETNAYTHLDQRSGRGVIYHAKMSLLTQLPGKPFNDTQVRRTCLHEAGHAYGLQGHSSDPGDVMYYAVSPNQSTVLSSRDRETICRLYSDYPDQGDMASKE